MARRRIGQKDNRLEIYRIHRDLESFSRAGTDDIEAGVRILGSVLRGL